MMRKFSIIAIIGITIGFIEALTGILTIRLEQSGWDRITFIIITVMIEVGIAVCIWSGVNVIRLLIGLIIKKELRSHLTPVVVLLILYGLVVILFQERDPHLTRPIRQLVTLDKNQKNILFIVIDTLRQDRLGCYGNHQIKTPALDRLSQKAMLFTQAVSQIPITAPSHLSMFTGLYPFQHGTRYNGMSGWPSNRLVTEYLSGEGYFTSAFVASAAVDGSVTGLSRGFNFYDDRFFLYNYNQRLRFCLPIRLLAWLGGFESSERRAHAVNERALAYLPEIMKRQPFFLWLHYYDPHMPYIPQSPYDHFYDHNYHGEYDGEFQTILDVHMGDRKPGARDLVYISSLYDGEVTYVDRSIENLLRSCFLHFPHEMKNATIIVVSDHGESLTEHNYYFFHAEKLYEPSIRAPLIIRDPASGIQRPVIQTELHLLLDLFATFLDVADITIQTDTPSISMLRPDDRQDSTQIKERIALSENGDRFFLGQEKYKIHLEKKSYSLRTRTKKYIKHPDGEEELYDLIVDPGELQNKTSESDRIEHFRHMFSLYESSLKKSVTSPVSIDPDAVEQLRSLGYIYE